MSWRTTGILFVILVMVGAVAFWQSRSDDAGDEGLPTDQAPVVENANLFGGVEIANVARLDIDHSVDTGASFRQEPDGGWFMTTPTATVVISQTVTNSLMGLINTGSRRTFAPDEKPLDAYGLQDPVREITIAVSRDGQVVRYRLQVGNETPAGDAYYVLKEGDRRVHLVTKATLDGIFSLATQPPLPETLPTPMPATP